MTAKLGAETRPGRRLSAFPRAIDKRFPVAGASKTTV